MPVPETPDEEARVREALDRWVEEFWLIQPALTVPDYVLALWPPGTTDGWLPDDEAEAAYTTGSPHP
jgi:hypothetical protein